MFLHAAAAAAAAAAVGAPAAVEQVIYSQLHLARRGTLRQHDNACTASGSAGVASGSAGVASGSAGVASGTGIPTSKRVEDDEVLHL